jgi:hypothetical protein
MCPEFSTNNKDSVNLSTTQLVETIPVDQPPYGLILYSSSMNDYGNLQTQNISTLNIQILSESGDFINFNNTNWTMTFILYIDRLFKVKLINNLDNVFNLASDLRQLPMSETTAEQVNEIPKEQPEESSLDQLNYDEELKLLIS